MRLTAPELAARYRDGLLAEGAHVIDAGLVGTEMLYFLVGSRELDGGLMCTASHNPKAYTGAKLVREGALALSGDEGIQDIRVEVAAAERARRAGASRRRGGAAPRQRRAGGPLRRVPARRAGLHRRRGDQGGQAAEGGPRRRQRHGRADGRAAAGGAGAGADRDLLDARTATSPTTSPTRCWRRTAASSSSRCASAAPTSGSPGTGTPTAASSSTTPASSSPATSSPRCSPQSLLRTPPRRGDPVRRARLAGGAGHRHAGRRQRRS